eukprot:NODE_1126_length_663_cov_260.372222_g1117_i0.p1 GENE.NODE_1126_length_663_cov_260.372222_g1117_i0~~NODE_1126_length_663_cov_260.372222_g1117_i0.p1  ORF type:complete len:182 (-),score=45.24 NODE_1126_length_663_cov_260.372222_g1117_i0:116-580(-)
MHYYERYTECKRNQHWAEQQISRARQIQDEMQADNVGLDCAYVVDAARQVRNCQQLLKFMFVYTYYLDHRSRIFEFNMKNMQEACEELGHLMTELTTTPVREAKGNPRFERQNVVNLAKHADSFLEMLRGGEWVREEGGDEEETGAAAKKTKKK